MNEKKPSNLTVSQQSGVVRNVINQLKLITRLMGDLSYFADRCDLHSRHWRIGRCCVIVAWFLCLHRTLPAGCGCGAYEGTRGQHECQSAG